MSHSKPLLIPWLKVKIDSAVYPGVFWTNPERTEFSIPWKHALRQDSSDTDILIFKVIINVVCLKTTKKKKNKKTQRLSIHQICSCSVFFFLFVLLQAWAEVSGNGRAQGDPSVWKRNFRSALRAKGFKLVADNKNDTANPHKVFHWPDDSGSGGESPPGCTITNYTFSAILLYAELSFCIMFNCTYRHFLCIEYSGIVLCMDFRTHEAHIWSASHLISTLLCVCDLSW